MKYENENPYLNEKGKMIYPTSLSLFDSPFLTSLWDLLFPDNQGEYPHAIMYDFTDPWVEEKFNKEVDGKQSLEIFKKEYLSLFNMPDLIKIKQLDQSRCYDEGWEEAQDEFQNEINELIDNIILKAENFHEGRNTIEYLRHWLETNKEILDTDR